MERRTHAPRRVRAHGHSRLEAVSYWSLALLHPMNPP